METTKNKHRIKTVWRFGKKYIPLFTIAEICILVSYTISILLPLNLKRLTDQVLYQKEYHLLPDILQSYIILFVIATIFNMLYAFVWQQLNNHYVVDIKNELFKKTIYAKAIFLTNMNSGDIMSRIDGDSEQFIHVIQRNLFHFVNSAILCCAVIWIIATINVTVAVMLIIAALLPIVLTKFCGRFTQKYAEENRAATGALTGRVFEILKGLRELRLACANWWINAQILTPLKRLIALGNRIRRVDFLVNKGIYFINLSASILIYAFSAYLILHDHLTVGVFLAVIEYIALLHKKFNWMLRIYLDWFSRKISIDRVNEILDQDSETNDGINLTQIEKVRFQNVSFNYGEKNRVLENISFEINRGEKLGLVGASGVGKSTLISLLLGFYMPTSGEIQINDIPLQNINPSSVRRLLGVVSQEILLFDESVRYNLSFGQEVPDAKLWDILDAVDLAELIAALPQGLDTKISATSHNLSGGQKQRLMIARALLKQANFIILDEATSALDVATEEKIMKYFADSSRTITMIVISHRLATIKDCDKIIVLNHGRIEEVGAHSQLIQSAENYQLMFGGDKHEN